MPKLYVFAIGGTGSRVLRSLTMMLAAGVRVGDNEIVPVIVDPDSANADLTRTVSLMNQYSAIRKQLTFTAHNSSEFFATPIDDKLSNYSLHIAGTDTMTFQQFIDMPSMSKANQAITRMLFSEQNLASDMNVGFKGNPNIGSVVLNQIVYSPDFVDFANSFAQGDKIFIISSIFGGTGASGFPLLLKTLRHGTNFPNHQLVNSAEIGALTVLPYFRVKQDDNSDIDSSTFISKAKAALSYYENNISRSGDVNALYFLGDEDANTYDNNEGGAAQCNDAHLIEFLGATAIVDFANRTFPAGVTANLELGVKDTRGAITFNSFYGNLHTQLYAPLVRFMLFANAITEQGSYYSSARFNANNENFNGFYGGNFYRQLTTFMMNYKVWLSEMKNNKRSLDLFNQACGSRPFEVVTDVKPKKVASLYSDYDLFTSWLNSAVKNCKSKKDEDKYMEMFHIATDRIVKEKLKN